MTTVSDVQAVGKEIDKIVKQLTQVEKSVKNSVKSAKTLTTGSAGGNPSASFGGLSEETKQVLGKYSAMGGMGGSGMMATSLGVISAGIGAMWNSVPGVDDMYTYKQQIFDTAFTGNGQFNADKQFGKIKAGFGPSWDGTAVNAANMMTNAGISTNSTRFGQTTRDAGMMSRFSGRSNFDTAAGQVAMQQGSQGVVGNLASVGIFVTDPTTGKSGGLRALVDQLWLRWYGSSTARVDSVQFDADLMGGWVGSDMQQLFGGSPELYKNVLDALRMKVKAGGASVNLNPNKNGKNSANALMGKSGIKTEDTPWWARQSAEQGRAENIADSSNALAKGFQDAVAAIDLFNKGMNNFINSEAGQMFFRAKAFTDTALGSQELGGIGNFLGGAGLMGLSSILRGVMGGGLGGGPKGSPGGMRIPGLGKIPLGGALARGGMLGGTAMAGGIGALGTMATMNGVDWLDDRNFSWAPDGGVVDRLGRFAGFMGGGAATGAGMGGPIGAILGTIGGAGYGIYDAITNPNGDSSAYMGGMFGSGSGSSFGQGMGGSLPNNPSEAVSWAAKSQEMTGAFDGLCDHYVARVYGLAHSGYQTARAHWQGIPDEYKYPGDKNPPVGALVFWDVGNSGHVAVVVGRGTDGPTVTTTHRGGTPTQMSLEECTRQLGGWGTYYGWSKPYFGGNSQGVGGPTSEAANKANKASKEGGVAPEALGAVGATGALGTANVMSSGLNVGGILGGSAGSVVTAGSSNNSTSVGGSSLGGTAGGGSPVPSAGIAASSLKQLQAYIKEGKSPPLAWDQSPLGDKSLIGVLQGAGFKGDDLREAYAIAKRESSGNPSSHNPNLGTGDYSYGLFQINMLGSLGVERDAKFKRFVKGYNGPDSLFDANVNARAAAFMSQDGNNWSSWVSAQYGKAADYYASYPGASAGMYLSRDQVVNAHAGEMIVPAYQTTQLKELLQGGIDKWKKPANITIHINVKNASREEAERFAKWIKQDLQKESVIDRMRSK